MRQAGRSLPEYRALRSEGSILDAIRTADLATEITLQPVRRHGVDAAVLFSDIMVPVAAIGFGVEMVAGVGPVVERPFRTRADLERLRSFEPDVDAPYVAATVAGVVEELGDTPLIGFAGGPFTLASYLVEGGPSRNQARTKAMMFAEPDLWSALLDRLVEIVSASLRSQIAAGASVVQLFDSWVGSLSPDDYARYVAPATRRVFANVAGTGVPRIHFGVETATLLEQIAATGADVTGIDWRVPLDQARRRLGADVSLQGNLDPVSVFAPMSVVRERVRAVLRANDGHPGHVFNLGHGVLPETDPGVLTEIVAQVHAEGRTDGTVAPEVADGGPQASPAGGDAS